MASIQAMRALNYLRQAVEALVDDKYAELRMDIEADIEYLEETEKSNPA